MFIFLSAHSFITIIMMVYLSMVRLFSCGIHMSKKLFNVMLV